MDRFLPYEKVSLAPFEHLPAELWSEELFSGGELINCRVTSSVRRVLEDLGVEEQAAPSAIAEGRLPAWRWLLDWLADSRRTVGISPEGRQADDDLAPTLDLLAHVTGRYPDWLLGKEEGERILFAPGTLALWQNYFSNRHRVARSLNLLGAFAAREALGDARNLRILEVGGGLGSAAEALLEELACRTESYLFTDNHAGFLRRGGDWIRSRFPQTALELARLDINGDFSERCSPGEEFDLIYGVNVFHLASDLLAALGRLRRLLSPRGRLIFVEGTRPAPDRPIAAEFIFQLLPQFSRVNLHPEYRPRPGFLTGAEWLEILRRAGFQQVTAIPDPRLAVEAYPNHSMCAFIAG